MNLGRGLGARERVCGRLLISDSHDDCFYLSLPTLPSLSLKSKKTFFKNKINRNKVSTHIHVSWKHKLL